MAAPAGPAVVSGSARYTLDVAPHGLLHLKLLRSPHAHARIKSINKDAALSVPGVRTVLTWEDAPRKLYSSARHEDESGDPDDTAVLDNVVRFAGQRVAAVIAESEGAAEAGCRKLAVDYELLPAVFDPEAAMQPGAPILHDKGPEARIDNAGRNIVAEVHSHIGNVEEGFAQADVVHEATYVTPRVQHAHLETHCAIGWFDELRRLNIRSSTQTPFLTRRALCGIFGLDPAKVRVFCERLGGGFGAKQEMLVEDIVALAVIKTDAPVKLEFTREEQFIGATTRHPMRVRIKAGARRDGRLTAMQMHVVSNTGAYGNHGRHVLYHACGECFAVYRCDNKKIDAVVVYTNTVPSGAFRGYGLPQTNFAVESAMDELARGIGMDPIAFRARNVVRPGDPMISTGAAEGADVQYGSYGLDQCLALVKEALDRDEPRSAAVARLARRTGNCSRHDRYDPAGWTFFRCERRHCARMAATSSPSERPNSATARTRCIVRSRPPCSAPPWTTSTSGSPIPIMAVTTPEPSAAPELSLPALPRNARRRPCVTTF